MAQERLGDGRGRPCLDVRDRQKILPEVRFGEVVRRGGDVRGQHPYGAAIGRGGAFGVALPWQVFKETLA